VLGLNDQIETNSQSSSGVGFAVPSNTVARVAQQIIGGKVVKHSYLGIHLKSGSPATVSTNSSSSAAVTSGSPAATAGIKPRDVITAINGKSIGSTEQFIATIDGYSPGTTVTLTIKRGGQSSDIKVTLGTRPS
jgi:S1-C subfamily serine protease